MNHCDQSNPSQNTRALIHNLGSFQGTNFRHHCPIERILTANEVVAWDHEREGQAEFWPSGDHAGASLIFGIQEVTASEIVALDNLLEQLGGDTDRNFLRIYYAMTARGCAVSDLTLGQLDNEAVHIFIGSDWAELKQEAAYELFELYYPEACAVWKKGTCNGLFFDPEQFLESPAWIDHVIYLGHRKVLIVTPA